MGHLPLKITDRLLADHKAFRKLLDDMDGIVRAAPADRDPARLRRLSALLKRTVLYHARVEDAVYFPAVAAASVELPEAFLRHLTEEHKTIDGYLSRLEVQVDARPPAVSWPQTFALLAAGLRAHFKREEEDLFPAADRALGADALEALSAEAERRKKEFE